MMSTFSIFVTLLIIHASTQRSIKPRIINGRDAPPERFHFIASIQISYLPWMSYSHSCTGIIYDEYHILTTGVCTKRISNLYVTKAKVKIGMYFTDKTDVSVKSYKIAEKITHENFTGFSNFWINDIGLIRLKRPIPNVVPAKIFESKEIPSGDGYILGWGKTLAKKTPKVLQFARIFYIDHDTCGALLANLSDYTRPFESQICFHSPTNYISGSEGDSGGPVVKYVNEEPEVVALLSWSIFPYAETGTPTVNTWISHYMEWIHENTKKKANVNSDDESDDNLSVPLLVSS